jgi:Glyoxalase/Bleomycin resistance protein/Dioxygenase superfamily
VTRRPSGRWAQVGPSGGQTSITLATWFGTMPPGSLKGLVLAADDLDADVTALRSRGVAIPDGVQEQLWGRFVTFDDPDGNGIVLQATSTPGG